MNIKFHLPDFAVHYHFNRVFLAMMKRYPEYFYEGITIASVYGTFPQSLWNGGRITSGVFDKDTVKTVVHAFDKLDIPLRFTFTNPTINEEDLDDDFCNYVLKTANNGKNGVIVVSPLLEEYIRTKYPDYKITSSTCKRITDFKKLSEEIEKNYDIVVLDYDFNNKFDILEKIQNKQKCEILVNAGCRPNCPKRAQHYKEIGDMQRAICKYMQTKQKAPFDPKKYNVTSETAENCPYSYYDFVDVKQHSTHVSPSDIFEKYIPMGFNQFKIEGRNSNVFRAAEYYLYYMVKPEYLDKARITFYGELINKEVISTAF